MVLGNKLHAVEHDVNWQIQPIVCVTQRVGTQCQFTLSVQVQNERQQEYCVYVVTLSPQRLFCSSEAFVQKELSLTIDDNTRLLLKDALGETHLQQPLRVKSTQRSTRFRVNNPWSLF
jgi:hypothetical protein|tara:strand:- start:2015 stop:2368 length:354 start_codon:yes stop_codon:yes gene_type:complete